MQENRICPDININKLKAGCSENICQEMASIRAISKRKGPSCWSEMLNPSSRFRNQGALVDRDVGRKVRSQGELVAFTVALDAEYEGSQRSQARGREQAADGGETSTMGSGQVAFKGSHPIAHREAARGGPPHDVIVDDLPWAHGCGSWAKEDSAGGSCCIHVDHRPDWRRVTAGHGWKSLA
jgi:hypothetical protein